jgi:hypothetical protein
MGVQHDAFSLRAAEVYADANHVSLDCVLPGIVDNECRLKRNGGI